MTDTNGTRGGSGRIFYETAYTANTPQRDIDQALVEAVWAWIVRARIGAFAEGNTTRGRMLFSIEHFVRECGRDLQNPFRVLTPRQRAGLIRCVPKAQQARFLSPGAPPAPEVLKNLPLKPPTRKVTHEDDE